MPQSSPASIMVAVALVGSMMASAQVPEITGQPVIDTPPLLEWPGNFEPAGPDLSEPTSNRLFDLHGRIGAAETFDLILSTSGNYHMALSAFWHAHFLPGVADIESWFYTTSPPISYDQIQSGQVTFGNLRLVGVPHVAVGPPTLMERLDEADMIDGEPVAILKNRGNVLLVRKGNPKGIDSIWSLAGERVRLVTPNPDMEPGSFGNYSSTIYGIASADPHPPEGLTAEDLFNDLFNPTGEARWLAGKRIHHRETPWSLIHGQADVAVIFHHLARYLVDQFPHQLEIVPLGGTVERPDPLPGNRTVTLMAAAIRQPLNPRQRAFRESLLDALISENFREVLGRHHMDAP